MKKTIYTLAFLLVVITAISIVLFLHVQTQDESIDKLERLNRQYISLNICLKAENGNLANRVESLEATILGLRGQAALFFDKITGITPFISGIIDLMSGDSWCGAGSYLQKNKGIVTKWCDWVNSNLPVKPGNNDTATGIIFPNGGENLICGKTYSILWMNMPGVQNVRIEFYNGTAWVIITNGTENDGNYSWRVPCETTENAKLYIAGIGENQKPGDVLYSQENFSISESDEEGN